MGSAKEQTHTPGHPKANLLLSPSGFTALPRTEINPDQNSILKTLCAKKLFHSNAPIS